MSRRRPLSREELNLWRRATADVKPLAELPEQETPPLERPASKPTDARNGVPAPRSTATPAKRQSPSTLEGARPLDPHRPVDIDRRRWDRLRRGQMTIERTLDLHGRTQTEAHLALDRFLAMAVAANLRCVLVVTGKGGTAGRGVLRQMVPRWLAEARHRRTVLTYCPAQPRHGGEGALYVLLRRGRRE